MAPPSCDILSDLLFLSSKMCEAGTITQLRVVPMQTDIITALTRAFTGPG